MPRYGCFPDNMGTGAVVKCGHVDLRTDQRVNVLTSQKLSILTTNIPKIAVSYTHLTLPTNREV